MTAIKQFEILDKGNACHKLTVTPNRVTIKLKKGTSKTERQEVIKFLTKVSEKDVMKTCQISYRGPCVVNQHGIPVSIELFNDRKTNSFKFDYI